MAGAALPTIPQVAHAAEVSYWTVRRYIDRGVIEAYRDQAGQFRCEPGAAAKVRRHILAHGGPGGRPLARA